MSKKKHKKRKPQAAAKPSATGMDRLIKKGNETMEVKSGSLNKGEFSLIFIAAAMLLASFVLSIISATFAFKQTLVFLLMGLGCLVLAYLQSKTIRMRKTGSRTVLFWLVLVLGVIYTLGGLLTAFMPELLSV